MRLIAARAVVAIAVAGAEAARAADGSAEGTAGEGREHVEFTITPYGWAPSVEGTMGVDGNESSFDVPIEDSIQYLKMGGMVGLEGRKGRWGLLFDGTYMELEDDAQSPGPFFTSVDVDYKQATADVGLFCRVYQWDRGWIDLLGGGRYMYFSTELGFNPDYAAAGELSESIVHRTTSAVLGEVESRAASQADRIAATLSTRVTDTVDELAAAARSMVAEHVRTRVGKRELQNIVDQAGDRLAEGLDGRGPDGSRGNEVRQTLVDAVQGAFETRVDNKLRSCTDRISIDAEAARLADALRDAVADGARRRILKQGLAIEGKPAAIRKAVHDAVRDAARDATSHLKKSASSDVRRALDRAEKALTQEITSGMERAADADVSESAQWVDPYIGMRARCLLTRRLYVGLRGDVGGFGIGSASELVWELFGGAGYEFNDTVSLEVGWRHLEFERDRGALALDLSYSGLAAGLAFRL